MPLTYLKIQNFRTVSELEWELAPGLNVLEGENAQGKTNLIEAVYFLINGKSFRTTESPTLLRFGQELSQLEGEFQHDGLSSRISIRLTPEKKETWLQGKPLKSLAQLHALLRALVFTPDSSTLLRGSPGVRRRYFDHAISIHRPTYSGILARYGRSLRQRNLLLEQRGQPQALEDFDHAWATTGRDLMEERKIYLAELLPCWRERFGQISGGEVPLESAWQGELWRPDVPELPEIMASLHRVREAERRAQRTLFGPHRDDLGVRLQDRPVRDAASQGQQRMLVIALKLAEADLFQKRTGRSPVFLLDDLGSELDRHHLGRLLQILGEVQAQTLLTTAQQGVYAPLHARTFRVQKGQLTPVS